MMKYEWAIKTATGFYLADTRVGVPWTEPTMFDRDVRWALRFRTKALARKFCCGRDSDNSEGKAVRLSEAPVTRETAKEYVPAILPYCDYGEHTAKYGADWAVYPGIIRSLYADERLRYSRLNYYQRHDEELFFPQCHKFYSEMRGIDCYGPYPIVLYGKRGAPKEVTDAD